MQIYSRRQGKYNFSCKEETLQKEKENMNTENEEELLDMMHDSGLLMKEKMTLAEWHDEMEQAVKLSGRMILGDNYLEDMDADEICAGMKYKARKLGCLQNEDVRKGIAAVKDFYHQAMIRRAGVQAEEAVSFRLQQVRRPIQVYRNVYLCDGDRQAELDDVVVTDTGIIILEVKNLMDHALLTRDGRLVRLYDRTSESEPLSDKMRTKRDLLKRCIRAEMKKRDMAFPVNVDSIVVFRTPADRKVHIEDERRSEPWCFDGALPGEICHYPGHIKLMKEQMQDLNTIMEDLSVPKLEIEMNEIDLEEIRNRFAKALAIMNAAENSREKKVQEVRKTETQKRRPAVWLPFSLGAAAAAASPLAAVCALTGITFLYLHTGMGKGSV